MDTHRNPTSGYQPGRHPGDHLASAVGSHAEIGRLLAHLEQRLAELDRLHREIAEDAQALAHAAAATPEGRDGTRASSVYSIRAAATELGVSVSMLHKLLAGGRRGQAWLRHHQQRPRPQGADRSRSLSFSRQRVRCRHLHARVVVADVR